MKFRYTGKNTFDIVAECSVETRILELLDISLSAQHYVTYEFHRTLPVRISDRIYLQPSVD